jgi:quercetin dioxygenase-like cupin family protein
LKPNQLEIRAAEIALGTLADRERSLSGAAADAELEALIGTWEQRLSGLSAALPPETPGAGVWAAITAAIDAEQAAVPGSATLRADEGTWIPILPGVAIKVLSVDDAAGMRSFLLRMAAGAHLPAHAHAKAEECLMLSGDLELGGLRLASGDYHLVPADVPHPPGFSRSGCLAFIRGDIDLAAA